MDDTCDCMMHDSFDTAYIGSDSRMRCKACDKVLLGWNDVTVGVDVAVAAIEEVQHG